MEDIRYTKQLLDYRTISLSEEEEEKEEEEEEEEEEELHDSQRD
jgi:hypothetical protein